MTSASAATPQAQAASLSSSPVHQAFLLLRAGFTIAPIAFGLDKFLGLLADWPTYQWSGVGSMLPGTANQVMLVVGVIEIAAGVLVAIKPRIGGYVVAAWLAAIIINLLLLGDHYDIALRDVGLLIGALALARLAAASDTT
jgi:hypothetical protein